MTKQQRKSLHYWSLLHVTDGGHWIIWQPFQWHQEKKENFKTGKRMCGWRRKPSHTSFHVEQGDTCRHVCLQRRTWDLLCTAGIDSGQLIPNSGRTRFTSSSFFL